MTAIHQGTKKILIADDDVDHCLAMRSILELAGHVVVEAHDGQTALDKLAAEQPDLVIFDSMLPQKTGLECLQFIKSHPALENIPVLICSGKGDLDYVLACSEAGAEGFVHKPYEPDDLRNRVRNILRSR